MKKSIVVFAFILLLAGFYTVFAEEEYSDQELLVMINQCIALNESNCTNPSITSNLAFDYWNYEEKMAVWESAFLSGFYYKDIFSKERMNEEKTTLENLSSTKNLQMALNQKTAIKYFAETLINKDVEYKILEEADFNLKYNLDFESPLLIDKSVLPEKFESVEALNEYRYNYYNVLGVLYKLYKTQNYKYLSDVLDGKKVIIYRFRNNCPEQLRWNYYFVIPDDLKSFFNAKLYFDNLDYKSAEIEAKKTYEESGSPVIKALALAVSGEALHKQGQYEKCHEELVNGIKDGIICDEILYVMGLNLIRLNKTTLSTTILEKVLEMNPYHERGHYYLGNGYAKYNYTQLEDKYLDNFAGTRHDRKALKEAKEYHFDGEKIKAIKKAKSTFKYSPFWVEPKIFLASVYWELEDFDEAEKYVFEVLELVPEYGRAHAIMARIQESRRLKNSVLAGEFAREFEAAEMPDVPGIEKYVINWKSLTPRIQKRVALSVAPWKNFVPVLNEVGATHYIKPLYEKLSECPQLESLCDARIGLDSRLWDDVRGCGGFNTVTGIEDVNRIIYGGYNTVIHELTHQVHGILTDGQKEEIENVYLKAKQNEAKGNKTFMSRYQGLTVWEYFAEGVNAYYTQGKEYDCKEVKYDRLVKYDKNLLNLVKKYIAITNTDESLVVGKVSKAYQYLESGNADSSLLELAGLDTKYQNEYEVLKAKAYLNSIIDNDLQAMTFAIETAERHKDKNDSWTTLASVYFHTEDGISKAIESLNTGLENISDQESVLRLPLAYYFWVIGDYENSVSQCNTVLKDDPNNPNALWLKAVSLADIDLTGSAEDAKNHFEDAKKLFESAITLRSGNVDLRLDYARVLILHKNYYTAQLQLNEVLNLRPDNRLALSYVDWINLRQGGEWQKTNLVKFENEENLPDFSLLLIDFYRNKNVIESVKTNPEYVFIPELYSYQTMRIFPSWMKNWIKMVK